ncbi:sugar phosphate isomerase/epimerase [Thalassobacillus sp. CUG 92003]|uniref:sugar phosphate isomerase/epimerase family protein n=1 Tax=Thalassobacillus sp. CUG 92003 TaxID=2736641 RepID=UPI0015E706A0|nr:sugar phosphate isomerase/epimerase [Thalassobacillus sp. CUG 92003]
MKLGFLTNAFVQQGWTDIKEIADWSVANGFQALEVGPNVPFEELESVVNDERITVGGLTYCRNFLSEDEEEARMHRVELVRRIKKAGELGIPLVITSTGIANVSPRERYDDYDAIRSKPENSLDQVVAYFREVVELAESVNVKLAFENCPLMGNIAISPKMWEALFARLDSPNVGLTYDPSHSVWQFIDPYLPIQEFGDRIFHVHVKDTEIDYDQLKRTGILTDFSWWRYRLPGLGELNWSKLIAELAAVEYDGMLSIEHEDPVWEGTLTKTQHALLFSKHYLDHVPGTKSNK